MEEEMRDATQDGAAADAVAHGERADVDMTAAHADDEEEAYKRSAREIAEKVRRQQEGEESNMLSSEHVDSEFHMTLDQVQELMQGQIALMSKAVQGHREQSGETYKEALGRWFVERSKFVPMRLTLEERKSLRLVDAALRGSAYVDKVDTVPVAGEGDKQKARRTQMTLRCIAATLTGIIAALDYEQGQELARDRNFAQHAEVFQELFEICRRYKIMNPGLFCARGRVCAARKRLLTPRLVGAPADRLRHSYGKLVMLMQDAMSPAAQDMLGFPVVIPIKTVHDVLERTGSLDALTSDWTATATMEIININNAKSWKEVRQQVKAKVGCAARGAGRLMCARAGNRPGPTLPQVLQGGRAVARRSAAVLAVHVRQRIVPQLQLPAHRRDDLPAAALL
jgi:hypothetical protein